MKVDTHLLNLIRQLLENREAIQKIEDDGVAIPRAFTETETRLFAAAVDYQATKLANNLGDTVEEHKFTAENMLNTALAFFSIYTN
jgi:hypothetical protein